MFSVVGTPRYPHIHPQGIRILHVYKKTFQIRCGHKCVACNKKKSVLADSSGMYKIVMDWVEKKKLWAIEALAEAYDSKSFPLNFPYSPVKAREYSLIAARRGLVDSQYNLASMYAAGDGGEQVRIYFFFTQRCI